MLNSCFFKTYKLVSHPLVSQPVAPSARIRKHLSTSELPYLGIAMKTVNKKKERKEKKEAQARLKTHLI